MATTTNFGWETPDDTDLVKDGAAAIRTALSGVDTSFVDLKGGTTGQVLAKASSTDLDYSWTTLGASAFVGTYAFRNTGLSTTGATDTVITMPSENFDTDAFHSTSTNTGRITIPAGKSGKYQINFYAYLSSSPGAYGRLRLFKNGANIADGVQDGTFFGYDGLGYLAGQGSTMISLTAGDYIELVMFGQNSCTVANAFITAQFLGA